MMPCWLGGYKAVQALLRLDPDATKMSYLICPSYSSGSALMMRLYLSGARSAHGWLLRQLPSSTNALQVLMTGDGCWWCTCIDVEFNLI